MTQATTKAIAKPQAKSSQRLRRDTAVKIRLRKRLRAKLRLRLRLTLYKAKGKAKISPAAAKTSRG